MKKGETWNESRTYRDPLTLRSVREVTTTGLYNQTPTYHTNTTLSADGRYLVFSSARNGGSAIMCCQVATGELTQLTELFPGTGGRAELHKRSGVCVGDGRGVSLQLCIAPKSLWAVFSQDRSVRAVHLESLEERVLIEDVGPDWLIGLPSVDPAEEQVVVPLMSSHPELNDGRRPTTDYAACFAHGGMQFELREVSLAGGPARTIYTEDNMGSAHCPHNPADPQLVLLDRDFPPNFYGGSDGKTNRIWAYNVTNGSLTELPSQDEKSFQVHSAWTWDGEAVVYHGPSGRGGTYFGVVSKAGEPIWEKRFGDSKYYGHVSAMAGRPAIIIDGNITPDTLMWLYYDKPQPRLEVIAKHSTDWGALHHQYPHPHANSDPTGRWISFNRGMRGRTDVCVVEV